MRVAVTYLDHPTADTLVVEVTTPQGVTRQVVTNKAAKAALVKAGKLGAKAVVP